ncbi:MAG: triple tyrosine motif-containing protein [Bacteroidetes bacterium]|nr:triple tyrosine motif-containing protein [Bacteroidota bacterium]
MHFKVIRIFLFIWLASFINFEIHASSICYGIPGIRNFSRLQHSGGIQSWSFAETENGLLYFANNSGLLEYNGATWKLYHSVKAVNRVVCADGNRVYVGAFNEFGYYEENERGTLQYHSLTNLIQGKISDFDEIWRIHKTSFGIVFQSFKAIFIYQGEKINIINPPSAFHFSYYVNGILWVYDEKQGLMQYREGKLLTVPGGDCFTGTQIWSILPLNNNEIIIGTKKNGLFRYNGQKVTPWGNKISQQLKKDQIYSAKKLKNDYFAFGSIQNGLIVTDTAGNLVFEINKERGLQNNTVLDVGQDYQGNIWLCLDNGISMIEFESPISYFQNYFDIGTLYASAKFGDNIYLGTNQGLFFVKVNDFVDPSKTKSNFKLIEGTEGQVWNLSVIDNTLFCGHNEGVFQVSNNKARKISSIPGAWNFLKIHNTGLILVGSYLGLSVLENRGGVWKLRNIINGFRESSRFVQLDMKGNIWVSQTYKGIYRIKIDSSWRNVLNEQFFDSKNGLPSNHSNLLFRIQSEILVATINGIFTFDYKTERFEKASRFKSYFEKEMLVDYLYQDSEQNIWFSADKHIGVLRLQEDGSYKKITIPFLKLANQVVPSFEHIQELNPNNVLIGIEGGFAHYGSKYNLDYSRPCTIYISELRSGDTSQGIYRYNSNNSDQTVIPAFKYKNNNISISFAANNYESPEVGFHYKLAGFDENWSEWSTQNFKEYTNLPDGRYTFMLRAFNNDLTAPSELSFKFIVLAPWYRSVFAWIGYFVVFILLIYLGRRYLNYRVEKSRLAENLKQKEKYLNRELKLKEESLIAEKEMQRLRNETLNLEIIHKEKELANSTMLLIQKNNILNKIQSDLQNLYSSIRNDEGKNNVNGLIKRIDKEIDNEKQWQVFNLHFEQVYEDLFKKLKESFPDLSHRELILCAYLRMNISSKEIATLMNISERGVEISRYRIRKKLGLDHGANLTEFMMSL